MPACACPRRHRPKGFHERNLEFYEFITNEHPKMSKEGGMKNNHGGGAMAETRTRTITPRSSRPMRNIEESRRFHPKSRLHIISIIAF
jgi:hypothetical protein